MVNGKHNGAYYYSREIVRNIIPNVTTDRNWITINIPGIGIDHSIVFIHNNLNIEKYEWLSRYEDLILVCGVPDTVAKVKHLGKAIYLPLSIDVKEVSAYKQPKEKRQGTAYAGRKGKTVFADRLPKDIEYIGDTERYKLLEAMATYETIYAVGRTAIEARCLGCRVEAYDRRYPNPELWKVIDNKEAAKMLQIQIDRIDKRGRG